MFHPELLLAPARKLMMCEGEPMSCQPSLVETRLLTMEISCMPQFIPVASQVNESTSAELKIQNEQRKLGLRVLKIYISPQVMATFYYSCILLQQNLHL